MPPTPGLDIFFRFAVALFIGLLVGLQREYAFADPDKELFGGVRTFALMGLIGGAPALRRAILPGYVLMMLTGTLLALFI